MTTKSTNRVEREARLRWVPLTAMRISPLAQRDIKPSWANYLAANMDIEQIGNPTVNERDGHFYVIDGQHRVEAVKQWLGGDWESQHIQCWTYVGLTEQDESEMFLKLNDVLTPTAMVKFRVGVQAQRPVETDIDRIVRAQGLRVTRDKIEGGIGAVLTLRRVYRRTDGATLGRTLRIIRDAYGDPGLESVVIDGIGHVCGRYNGSLDDARAISQLATAHGGVNGLLNAAQELHFKTGKPKGQCVAAAAVDLINRGKGAKKLMSWWKSEAS